MKDTDTNSLRRERGESTGERDPKDRMREVPLAPASAGALGVGAAPDVDEREATDTLAPEIEEARKRERESRTEVPE